ncbi:hypothetical protein ACJX0J_007196, partial [Zea mays]
MCDLADIVSEHDHKYFVQKYLLITTLITLNASTNSKLAAICGNMNIWTYKILLFSNHHLSDKIIRDNQATTIGHDISSRDQRQDYFVFAPDHFWYNDGRMASLAMKYHLIKICILNLLPCESHGWKGASTTCARPRGQIGNLKGHKCFAPPLEIPESANLSGTLIPNEIP